MAEVVSIIVPTYNHGKYISNCINSVLHQTYRSFEVIIIDNYSNDHTADIVSDIINKNPCVKIKFIQYDNNGVIAASRNHGVKHSSGNYIAFLDSDDAWESDKLHDQIESLEHPNISAVASRFYSIGDGHSYDHLSFMSLVDYFDASYQDILISNPIITSSILMKKSIFLALNGFNEDKQYKFIEDWEFWLRLSYKFGSIRIVNRKHIAYRVYNHKGRDLSDDSRRSLMLIDREYDSGFVSKSIYRQARSYAYINYAVRCIIYDNRYKRIPLVMGMYLVSNLRYKLKSIALLFLSLIPFNCVRLVIINMYLTRRVSK